MQKSVTFRFDENKLHLLDALASNMDRDRSYLIQEALEQYLEVKQWHIAHITNAIEQADEGRFFERGGSECRI